MAESLAQPGCYTNTGTGCKRSRPLIKLETVPPSNNYTWRKGFGKSSSVSPGVSPGSRGSVINSERRNEFGKSSYLSSGLSSRMRGSVTKPERKKKIKLGKKVLGRQSSFLQFDSRRATCNLTPRERVLSLREKFGKVRMDCGTSWQACAIVKRRFPLLIANKLHDRVGDVPGVEVGDCFNCRAELALVGLHQPSQAGIDWKDVSRGGSIISIAVAVVVSGGYEDDVDEGEVLTYTGEGGKDAAGRQCEDQKLEGGNLALYNSRIVGNPVRVIRGRVDSSSPSKMTYSYDGLYKVVDHRKEPGLSNYNVFKFKLVREPGQVSFPWYQISPRAKNVHGNGGGRM